MSFDYFPNEENTGSILGGRDGGRAESIKLQRWRGCYKYTNAIPVIPANPTLECRVYPDYDPEHDAFSPYIENGRLTWVWLGRGVDYLGMKIPEAEVAYNISMWLMPSNITDYYDVELNTMTSPRDKYYFALKHCPYALLYSRMTNSIKDADTPIEWGFMTSNPSWQKFTRNTKDYAPIKQDELHGLILGEVFEFAGESFDEPLKPVAIEFRKSATVEFVSSEKVFHEKTGKKADTEEALYKHYKAIDPAEGFKIRLVKKSISRDKGVSYQVHSFSVPGAVYPISPEEIKNSWHPFEEAVEINSITREPIISHQTCEQQLATLMTIFSPEIVDYCFQNTPYYRGLPSHARGSFDRYQSSYRAKPAGFWYAYHRDRCIAEKEGKFESTELPGSSSEDLGAAFAGRKPANQTTDGEILEMGADPVSQESVDEMLKQLKEI